MEVRRLRNDELYHHGIKGQRWGVRRYQNADGSLTPAGMRHYNRQAKEDAKEYARAKMFYGEGAGTRRKLIKAKVNERSKNEYYKKQFDSYLETQNMEKHAKAATSERHRKDVANTTKKTARGIKNLALGTGASVTASAAIIYGGYRFVKNNPQMVSAMKKKVKDIKKSDKSYKKVKDWINTL